MKHLPRSHSLVGETRSQMGAFNTGHSCIPCTPWEVDSWHVRYWVHLLLENQPDFFRQRAESTSGQSHLTGIDIEFFRKRLLNVNFRLQTPTTLMKVNANFLRQSTLIYVNTANAGIGTAPISCNRPWKSTSSAGVFHGGMGLIPSGWGETECGLSMVQY